MAVHTKLVIFGGVQLAMIVWMVYGADCEVSGWGQWGECTGTCLFALRVRNRDVKRPPFPELSPPTGILLMEPCPPLYQVQQCSPQHCLDSVNGTKPKYRPISKKITAAFEKEQEQRGQPMNGEESPVEPPWVEIFRLGITQNTKDTTEKPTTPSTIVTTESTRNYKRTGQNVTAKSAFRPLAVLEDDKELVQLGQRLLTSPTPTTGKPKWILKKVSSFTLEYDENVDTTWSTQSPTTVSSPPDDDDFLEPVPWDQEDTNAKYGQRGQPIPTATNPTLPTAAAASDEEFDLEFPKPVTFPTRAPFRTVPVYLQPIQVAALDHLRLDDQVEGADSENETNSEGEPSLVWSPSVQKPSLVSSAHSDQPSLGPTAADLSSPALPNETDLSTPTANFTRFTSTPIATKPPSVSTPPSQNSNLPDNADSDTTTRNTTLQPGRTSLYSNSSADQIRPVSTVTPPSQESAEQRTPASPTLRPLLSQLSNTTVSTNLTRPADNPSSLPVQPVTSVHSAWNGSAEEEVVYEYTDYNETWDLPRPPNATELLRSWAEVVDRPQQNITQGYQAVTRAGVSLNRNSSQERRENVDIRRTTTGFSRPGAPEVAILGQGPEVSEQARPSQENASTVVLTQSGSTPSLLESGEGDEKTQGNSGKSLRSTIAAGPTGVPLGTWTTPNALSSADLVIIDQLPILVDGNYSETEGLEIEGEEEEEQGGTLARTVEQGGTVARTVEQGGTVTRTVEQGGTVARTVEQGGTVTRTVEQGGTVTRTVSTMEQDGLAGAVSTLQQTTQTESTSTTRTTSLRTAVLNGAPSSAGSIDVDGDDTLSVAVPPNLENGDIVRLDNSQSTPGVQLETPGTNRFEENQVLPVIKPFPIDAQAKSVTIALSGTPRGTTLASTPSKLTTVPSVSSKLTTVPDVPSKLTTVPSVSSKLTTVPDVPSKLTTVPDVPSKLTTVPDVPSKLTTVPDVPSKLTTVPYVPSKLTTEFTSSTSPPLPAVPGLLPAIDEEEPELFSPSESPITTSHGQTTATGQSSPVINANIRPTLPISSSLATPAYFTSPPTFSTTSRPSSASTGLPWIIISPTPPSTIEPSQLQPSLAPHNISTVTANQTQQGASIVALSAIRSSTNSTPLGPQTTLTSTWSSTAGTSAPVQPNTNVAQAGPLTQPTLSTVNASSLIASGSLQSSVTASVFSSSTGTPSTPGSSTMTLSASPSSIVTQTASSTSTVTPSSLSSSTVTPVAPVPQPPVVSPPSSPLSFPASSTAPVTSQTVPNPTLASVVTSVPPVVTSSSTPTVPTVPLTNPTVSTLSQSPSTITTTSPTPLPSIANRTPQQGAPTTVLPGPALTLPTHSTRSVSSTNSPVPDTARVSNEGIQKKTQNKTSLTDLLHRPCGDTYGNRRCCKQAPRARCPDGRLAQQVMRWHRLAGSEQCISYSYGYCGFDTEASEEPIKFQEECYEICYTDEEKRTLPIFSQLALRKSVLLQLGG